MAKNLSLGAILGIVIVTALIVSIATTSITGNVIKVNNLGALGKYKIYTQEEIDAKLDTIIAYFSKSSNLDFKELYLTSDEPESKITINGKSYTIQLVSASDTAATIKIIGGNSPSQSKEIGESSVVMINGLLVGVNTADETNFKLSTTITIYSTLTTR